MRLAEAGKVLVHWCSSWKSETHLAGLWEDERETISPADDQPKSEAEP